MIEEWEYSARNIIYHFRAIVKGMVPFSQKWTEEMKQLADVDDEAMEYIKKTSEMIRESGKYASTSYRIEISLIFHRGRICQS
jgi:ribosomal protein L13